MKWYAYLIAGLVFLSCSEDDGSNEPPDSDVAPNILLIIADDLGKDAFTGFSEGSVKPSTPNLDRLRGEGLTFTNMWVNPTCTPTRASIITGKYGYRTGVKAVGDNLSATEAVLQRYIAEESNQSYSTAIVGKWHLGTDQVLNPEDFGIDYYVGLIRGSVQSYYRWQMTEDGVETVNTEYATTAFTDLAIDWVNQQSEPWFLWLAYNAPHTPFHVPPSEMHSQGSLPDYDVSLDATPYYMAAIEAMDYQIGRLLDEIPDDEIENTVIIFIGDNGTPAEVAQTPYGRRKAKGTLYQGGINVPMFVTGKGVTRMGEDDNLVTSTDLFSTIANIAGVGTNNIHDSKSFIDLLSAPGSHRGFQYSDTNDGTSDLYVISNGDYKLLVNEGGETEMYDLQADPYEDNNLLNGVLTSQQEAAKAALEAELMNIRN
jgi:arylsulfatase A-like enzyme